MEWNWNGNGMENFEMKYSMRNGMEREWKWNGNGMEKKVKIKWNLNLMEWNGNGKEMEWK